MRNITSVRYPTDAHLMSRFQRWPPGLLSLAMTLSSVASMPNRRTTVCCQVASAQDLMKEVPASGWAARVCRSMSLADASISEALRVAGNWSFSPANT